ncbi:MAG: TolC family outer membrane protein [Burkholderiaceae bacterium]|nr:TolC family outer membrane protein [Burkholderiaceae bacterium]
MISRTPISIAILAFAVSGAAWTAPVDSLKSAVEKAILENPEVKFKHKSFLAATSEQNVAAGDWRPKVDLEAKTGQETTLSPGMASTKDYTHSVATLQLRQTLFDGFATSSNVRRLGHARQAAYYDLLASSDNTGLEAARAYLDVQRYRDLVELAKENYANHADVHGRIESRVKAGVGRRVDLEQASGRLALAESNWLTEASNLHDVTARYQRLIGEQPATSLAPVPDLSSFLPARENYVPNTVRNNPEFLSAVSSIRTARADADLRRAGNYPTLEFRAQQSVETNRSGVNGDYRDTALQLVLNYNLYRGGSDSARIKQYVEKINASYDLRDKVCRDVRQTALIALNDVSKLESQIGFLSQHELSTAKAREAYRQQFDIGQRSLLDLLDTENEFYQSRRALTNAEFDLSLARTRVLAANGSLLGALKLRPLHTEVPPQPGGVEEGDDAMLCNAELALPVVLDKSSLPRPSLISAPVPVAPPPVPLPAPTPAPEKAICDTVAPSVEKWIAAWNNKDINGYLGVYADNFVPAQGLSRTQWESLRKKRVGKQGGISTVLKNITPAQCNGKSSEVSFVQEYGSDDYRDVVEKTLSMEYVGGAWKILKETVTKGRTF